jgi:hypothetical protein
MQRVIEVRISWLPEAPPWTACAQMLSLHGFKGDVHPSLSVRQDGAVEQGALVRLYDADLKVFLQKLWPALREHFNLTCAHVTVVGGFAGCVHELLPAGRCPHRRLSQVSESPEDEGKAQRRFGASMWRMALRSLFCGGRR